MACPSRERALGGDPSAAPPEADFSHAQIMRACDASLKRLQTSYIDLYQLHWPERYVPKWGESQYVSGKAAEDRARSLPLEGFDAVVRSMGALLQAGKIKAWGVSNETSYGVCAFAEACKRLGVAPPVSIQNGLRRAAPLTRSARLIDRPSTLRPPGAASLSDFSLCFRSYEGELAETCAPHHHNLGLLAYGVLNGGALSGKYLAGAATPAAPSARFNFAATVGAADFQHRYKRQRAASATEEYVALAESLGTDGATLAQAWAYSREYMAAVIIGATSLAQLEANWAAATYELTPETLAKIDEIHCRHRNPNLQD